jgi:ankyrin repeat protein
LGISGRTAAVKFIISKIGDDVNSVDRWGGTALDDAVHHNHEECAAAIKAAGGVENKAFGAPAIGEKRSRAEGRYHEEAVSILEDEVIFADAPMVLFAAAEGDVDQLVKFRASGVDLFVKDYDHRTALHLAASNGHAAAMAYLLAQAGANAKTVATVQDRWGTTPHGDTVREGKGECQALLEAVM